MHINTRCGGGRDSAYRDLIEKFPNVNLDSGSACKTVKARYRWPFAQISMAPWL
jgi:hypothetical protein